MLSYIHAFHAGNHADILKHIVLSFSLEHLCKKEKPFTVFDTHAGSGLYRLDDERLEKTGEAESGIKLLFSTLASQKSRFSGNEAKAAKEIENSVFFKIVRPYFEKNTYPGSPLVENAFLRPGDEQVLSELHPRTIEELTFTMEKYRSEAAKPHIHFRNGFEMLLSLVPPKTKRGLVIIDPSFEEKADFEDAAKTICQLLRKWRGAVVLLWYPLVPHRKTEISMMKERISAIVQSEEKIADFQLVVKDESELTGLSSLYGSGMFVVNPPFGLAQKMENILPLLEKILSGKISD